MKMIFIAGVVAICFTSASSAANDDLQSQEARSQFIACSKADFRGSYGDAIYREADGTLYLVSDDVRCRRS
jgi:hypothetical protein